MSVRSMYNLFHADVDIGSKMLGWEKRFLAIEFRDFEWPDVFGCWIKLIDKVDMKRGREGD